MTPTEFNIELSVLITNAYPNLQATDICIMTRATIDFLVACIDDALTDCPEDFIEAWKNPKELKQAVTQGMDRKAYIELLVANTMFELRRHSAIIAKETVEEQVVNLMRRYDTIMTNYKALPYDVFACFGPSLENEQRPN